MNSLVVYKIETAILENTGIIKLYGDGKYFSHASVSDNTGNNNRYELAVSAVREPGLSCRRGCLIHNGIQY